MFSLFDTPRAALLTTTPAKPVGVLGVLIEQKIGDRGHEYYEVKYLVVDANGSNPTIVPGSRVKELYGKPR